ncbi:hypothetical protein TNCV_1551661 [Trichonephila clavipes]|nr:hypothetical protein TNCV_1551661 [Trichonephila clavipes]
MLNGLLHLNDYQGRRAIGSIEVLPTTLSSGLDTSSVGKPYKEKLQKSLYYYPNSFKFFIPLKVLNIIITFHLFDDNVPGIKKILDSLIFNHELYFDSEKPLTFARTKTSNLNYKMHCKK